MALSVVQAVKTNGLSTSLTATITSTTAGNLLVAVIMDGGAFINAPTFTAPTGFTSCGSEAQNTNHAYVHVYKYENNPGGITSVAFSGLTNSVQHHVYVWEISGVATSGTQDGYVASPGGSGTALNAGSITAIRAHEIVFGLYVSNDASDTPTYASGYTGNTDGTVNSTAEAEYQIFSATGTYTPSVTASASSQWAGIAISFVAAPEHTQSVTATEGNAASMSRLVVWPIRVVIALATVLTRVRTVYKRFILTRASVANLKQITVLITLLFTAGHKSQFYKGRFRTILVPQISVMRLLYFRVKMIAVLQATVATLSPLRAILVAVKSTMAWVFGVTVLKVLTVQLVTTPTMLRSRLRILFVAVGHAASFSHLRLRTIFVAAASVASTVHIRVIAIIIQEATSVVVVCGRLLHVLIAVLFAADATLRRSFTKVLKATVSNSAFIKFPRILKVLIAIAKATSATQTRRVSDPSLAHRTTYNIVSTPGTTFDIEVEQ